MKSRGLSCAGPIEPVWMPAAVSEHSRVGAYRYAQRQVGACTALPPHWREAVAGRFCVPPWRGANATVAAPAVLDGVFFFGGRCASLPNPTSPALGCGLLASHMRLLILVRLPGARATDMPRGRVFKEGPLRVSRLLAAWSLRPSDLDAL